MDCCHRLWYTVSQIGELRRGAAHQLLCARRLLCSGQIGSGGRLALGVGHSAYTSGKKQACCDEKVSGELLQCVSPHGIGAGAELRAAWLKLLRLHTIERARSFQGTHVFFRRWLRLDILNCRVFPVRPWTLHRAPRGLRNGSIQFLLSEEFRDQIRDLNVVQVGEDEVGVAANADLGQVHRPGITAIPPATPPRSPRTTDALARRETARSSQIDGEAALDRSLTQHIATTNPSAPISRFFPGVVTPRPIR